jgi:RimJ/RimL family protein N-acetyltransferase
VGMHSSPSLMPTVPVVETERLRLRGYTLDDFDHCRALWTDSEVVRWMSGKPFTLEECWTRFLRYVGHWSVMGFGYWAVEERLTGDFVGEVGMGNFKRDLDPPLGRIPELGWILAPSQHGKGYATEAAVGALRWGRTQLRAESFACIIHPDNRASLRVAAKCGFGEEQRSVYKGRPAIIFKTA